MRAQQRQQQRGRRGTERHVVCCKWSIAIAAGRQAGRRNWEGNAAATMRPTQRQSSFPFGLHATPRGGEAAADRKEEEEQQQQRCVLWGESKLNLCCSAAFNLIVISFVFIAFALRCLCLRFNFINLSCVYCVKHLPSHGVDSPLPPSLCLSVFPYPACC